jgi:hypothetical protein
VNDGKRLAGAGRQPLSPAGWTIGLRDDSDNLKLLLAHQRAKADG